MKEEDLPGIILETWGSLDPSPIKNRWDLKMGLASPLKLAVLRASLIGRWAALVWVPHSWSWGSGNSLLQVWGFTANKLFPCISREVSVSFSSFEKGLPCPWKFLLFASLETKKSRKTELGPVLTFCWNALSLPGSQHVEACFTQMHLLKAPHRYESAGTCPLTGLNTLHRAV